MVGLCHVFCVCRYVCKCVTNGGFTNLKAVSLGWQYLCQCSKQLKGKRERGKRNVQNERVNSKEKENKRKT